MLQIVINDHRRQPWRVGGLTTNPDFGLEGSWRSRNIIIDENMFQSGELSPKERIICA